jgi:hypothetical protein
MHALKANRKVWTAKNQNRTIHVPFREPCCRIFNAGSNNKRGGLYSGVDGVKIFPNYQCI